MQRYFYATHAKQITKRVPNSSPQMGRGVGYVKANVRIYTLEPWKQEPKKRKVKRMSKAGAGKSRGYLELCKQSERASRFLYTARRGSKPAGLELQWN